MTFPTLPDAEPVSLARNRRLELARQMRAAGGGVAVLLNAPEILRNGDAHYPYRHDSNFHYLTAFDEPESALLLEVDQQGHRATLFCRPRNEEREIWDGFRHGPDAARDRFGFDAAHPIEELDSRLPDVIANQSVLWYALGQSAALDRRVRHWLSKVRAKVRSGTTAPGHMRDLCAIVEEMRLIKQPGEIALMERAGAISAQAHCRAMRFTHPGVTEYEVEAELLHEFHRSGAQAPAYGSIVAGGAQACILHYRANNAVLRDGDLLLIDAGCEFNGYAGDITRTFPISGQFSGPQAALYDIVLAAQEAAIAATVPGRRFDEPHEVAVRVLAQGMLDTGLLQGTLDGVLESGAYRRFYMHRTGHWLGRDVHDCGSYREPGSGERAADAPAPGWRPYEPGMVVTVEPGLYVRAADDVPEAFHDIGIRIEDDILVTPQGARPLTRDVPVQRAEIEALMRSGRRVPRPS